MNKNSKIVLWSTLLAAIISALGTWLASKYVDNVTFLYNFELGAFLGWLCWFFVLMKQKQRADEAVAEKLESLDYLRRKSADEADRHLGKPFRVRPVFLDVDGNERGYAHLWKFSTSKFKQKYYYTLTYDAEGNFRNLEVKGSFPFNDLLLIFTPIAYALLVISFLFVDDDMGVTVMAWIFRAMFAIYFGFGLWGVLRDDKVEEKKHLFLDRYQHLIGKTYKEAVAELGVPKRVGKKWEFAYWEPKKSGLGLRLELNDKRVCHKITVKEKESN